MTIRRFATAAAVAGTGFVLFASAAGAFNLQPEPPAVADPVTNVMNFMFPVSELEDGVRFVDPIGSNASLLNPAGGR